jgi:hypothetical protein
MLWQAAVHASCQTMGLWPEQCEGHCSCEAMVIPSRILHLHSGCRALLTTHLWDPSPAALQTLCCSLCLHAIFVACRHAAARWLRSTSLAALACAHPWTHDTQAGFPARADWLRCVCALACDQHWWCAVAPPSGKTIAFGFASHAGLILQAAAQHAAVMPGMPQYGNQPTQGFCQEINFSVMHWQQPTQTPVGLCNASTCTSAMLWQAAGNAPGYADSGCLPTPWIIFGTVVTRQCVLAPLC